MITWYNHPYYQNHFEALGFKVEKSYSESKFPFENVKPDTFFKAQELIKRRYQLKALNFTKTRKLCLMLIKCLMCLINHIQHYRLLLKLDIQKEYFKKKFIGFVNPEYVKFVVDKNDKLIGFAIVLPPLQKLYKK